MSCVQCQNMNQKSILNKCTLLKISKVEFGVHVLLIQIYC